MAKRKRTQSEGNDCQHGRKVPVQRNAARPTQKSSASKRRKNGDSETEEDIRGDTPPNNASSNVNQDSSLSTSHPKSIHVVSSPSPIRRALLIWYSTVHSARGMPWRKPYDSSLNVEQRAQRAYEVWVSEVMLQQTQVATVIPYYNNWMVRFPTIRHLAESSLDEVNALWKGLGYYSRASRLLTGAQKVVKDYEGRLPEDAKELEANIPGIGRYSAGAICSIAYHQHVPVLDGNVHRLFSRFLALHAPPKSKATLDLLWAAATAMVTEVLSKEELANADGCESVNHPGDINQALIELGSTVCKVRDPNCSQCPLNRGCVAYKNIKSPLPDIEDLCTLCEPLLEGQAGITAYPMKVDKKKARSELDIVNVVEWRSEDDRKVLLVKRPDKGLLAGLYEFPTMSNIAVSTSNAKASELAHEGLADILETSIIPLQNKFKKKVEHRSAKDYHITQIHPIGDVLHAFSHIKKTYRVQWVVIEGGTEPPRITQAVRPHSLSNNHGIIAEQPGVWTSATEVPQANIGTGVGKIWKLVSSVWEKGLDED